ncbi:MAG TPA: ABC transporter permease [Rhizobiaceae bacterium]|nr:ABC transporter permease [Rhizobiaceae bacterium]
MRAILLNRGIQALFVLLVIAGWMWATEVRGVSRLFLPPLDSVAASFQRLVSSGAFYEALKVTLSTVAQAYAIAVVSGILIGYLVSRSRFSTAVFEPVISGIFAIPLTLFFPLFILFLGVGVSSKIAYAALYSFFPVCLNTIAGLQSVEPRYIQAARSMGASSLEVFRHVQLPAAFPVLVNGLRVSFLICFAAVLGGEVLMSVEGLGRNISQSAESMNTASMYAWIVFVILTAFVLNMVVTFIENRAKEY